MRALRCVVICPDVDLAEKIEDGLNAADCTIVRSFDYYLNATELKRMADQDRPHIVFISSQDVEQCATIGAVAERSLPDLHTVAVGPSCEADVLSAIMYSGIREYLALPFEETCLMHCLSRVAEHLDRIPVQRARVISMPLDHSRMATRRSISAELSF